MERIKHYQAMTSFSRFYMIFMHDLIASPMVRGKLSPEESMDSLCCRNLKTRF
jgi:hypothetical protein